MSTDLKTQFINYMTINRFSQHTQKNYILAVKGLARFYSQPPDALSGDQIQNYLLYLIQEKNLKHRVLLKTVYSAGLRLSEAICLRPEHIESDPSRMMIRVEQGKGNKDRYTILSRSLLPELRTYWRKYQPGEWLFPGHKRNRHMGSTTACQIYKKAKKKPALPGAGVFMH